MLLTAIFCQCSLDSKKTNKGKEHLQNSGKTAEKNWLEANYAERKKREETALEVEVQTAAEKNTVQAWKKKRKTTKTKRSATEKGSGIQNKGLDTANKTEKGDDGPLLEEIVQGDDESEDEDENFAQKDWRIVGHAVDKEDGKAKFKVIHGIRQDGREKSMWGAYAALKQDRLAGLDNYILASCPDIPVYTGLINRKRKKVTVEKPANKVSVRTQCNHGDQFSYRDETNAAYCGRSYYLHGVRCGNNCGAAFVSARTEEHPTGSRVVVPTGNAPAHCCVNIRRSSQQQGQSGEEQCKHVICFDCWKKAILAQSDDAPRGRRSTNRN